MSRTNLARLLHRELERLAPRYASLSVEHAPLSTYPTLASLVDRLTDPKKNKSRTAQRERSELLSAIIGAYQPTRDRLWGAILVAAFRPMLATKRFYGADPEEREAIFLAALTEVVGKLDVRQRPDQVHAIVWRSAKKVLVRKLRRQTTWSEVGFGDDADATPDRTSSLPEPWLAAWLLSRGAKDRPDLDLIVRVEEWGSLKAYVEAEYAALPPTERSQVYGRLQRRHRRAVCQLREVFAPEKLLPPGLPSEKLLPPGLPPRVRGGRDVSRGPADFDRRPELSRSLRLACEAEGRGGGVIRRSGPETSASEAESRGSGVILAGEEAR
jgi:hypothetical protein